MENIEILFVKLIFKINRIQITAFSGIGLLLYSDINTIEPYHCNLLNSSDDIPNLHLSSVELVNYLVNISSLNHPNHDGFHFINHNGYLTHVAQFLSPPIDKKYVNIHGQGSRTLCSLHGSILSGVLMVAIISSKRDIYFFKNGRALNINADSESSAQLLLVDGKPPFPANYIS